MRIIILLIGVLFFLTGCSNNVEENVTQVKENTNKAEILAIGDSLTAGYNLEYSDSYPIQLEGILEENGYNYKVINAGVSGDTSKNLLSRIGLYNEKYDLVLLNIGGNDGLRSLSAEDLENNIKKIIKSLEYENLVLFSIDLPENYSKDYRNEIKKAYENIKLEENVVYYGLFFEGLDYKKHFLSDGLHPNEEGYEIISQNIYNFLTKNNLIEKG